mmetsp:Transcript_5974/g.23189  ORF Transcript_5974/g.23189 Transcript_5974/m.23189 type:complete len:253 (+) Transcript_5974:78-836(+)
MEDLIHRAPRNQLLDLHRMDGAHAMRTGDHLALQAAVPDALHQEYVRHEAEVEPMGPVSAKEHHEAVAALRDDLASMGPTRAFGEAEDAPCSSVLGDSLTIAIEPAHEVLINVLLVHGLQALRVVEVDSENPLDAALVVQIVGLRARRAIPDALLIRPKPLELGAPVASPELRHRSLSKVADEVVPYEVQHAPVAGKHHCFHSALLPNPRRIGVALVEDASRTLAPRAQVRIVRLSSLAARHSRQAPSLGDG